MHCGTLDIARARTSPYEQEVAQRLSFDWSGSLTIRRAVADWLALRKGELYEILDPDEQAAKRAETSKGGGDDAKLPTRTTTVMVRWC